MFIKNKGFALILIILCMMFSMFIIADAVNVSIVSNGTANFTNAQFYVLGSSNVTTYTSSSGTKVAGSIYPGDLCTVLDATGTYWKISYPTSSGQKTAYCNKTNILSSTNYCKRITIAAKTSVYRKSDMSTAFGSVYTTDTVYMLCAISNGKAQIIYNISGGYKIGWIYAATATSPTPTTSPVSTTSWRYPMDNAQCTWSSYTNMSWANDIDDCGKQSQRHYHLGIDIKGSNDNVYAAAEGTVSAVGYNGANGYFVVIKHNVGKKVVYSFYAHLAKGSNVVSSGDKIKMGDKIAKKGNTGSSAVGYHLHFAVADTLKSDGSYYGYSTYFTGNVREYSGTTYYNPNYLINNNKLP